MGKSGRSIHPPLEGGSKLSLSASEKRISGRAVHQHYPAPKNSSLRSEFFDPPSSGGWYKNVENSVRSLHGAQLSAREIVRDGRTLHQFIDDRVVRNEEILVRLVTVVSAPPCSPNDKNGIAFVRTGQRPLSLIFPIRSNQNQLF